MVIWTFFLENPIKKIDLQIQGEHDVDLGWISEVKSTGAKVVPRLIFEKFRPQILKQLLENEQIITVSSFRFGLKGTILSTFYVDDLWYLVQTTSYSKIVLRILP